MMVNVLIIGSGAREHIIAVKLAQSARLNKLYCWASQRNPGLVGLCEHLKVGNLENGQAIAEYAVAKKIDFAIIGPELPLSKAVADELIKAGVACIGPTQKLAQIETSKGYAREILMAHHADISPAYKCFTSVDGVKLFLNKLGEAYVVKADGLMGGKGVKIAGEHLNSHAEAIAYCDSIFESGQDVIIEEKLIGEEFSLLSFCDGKTLTHMPTVQDHKRALEGDRGPNTGGMGTYTGAHGLLPFLTAQDVAAAEKMNEQAIAILQDENEELYKGILYGSYMLTASGVKLIEYNARFGDSEVMNLLTLLETDLVDICEAIVSEKLAELDIQFSKAATVCKYLVPEGYPNKPIKHESIIVPDKLANAVDYYFGSIEEKENQLLLLGSRAIAVVATAEDVESANQKIEAVVSEIKGPLFHRRDIGNTALINRRIEHINQLCGRSLPLL